MPSILPPPELASPDFQRLLQQCIHCGLCLQACPTYSVFGRESDSPRGRIALMQAAAVGRIELGAAFEQHIDLCLGCRACETACPSGVQYGALVEQARLALERSRPPGRFESWVRRLGVRGLMPHLGRLRGMARLLRMYQLSGLPRLVRKLNLLPGPLRVMEGMLPPLETRYRDYRQPLDAPNAPRGEVAFFHGCIQDAFLAGVNAATLRVLQRNGYGVRFPQGQTCCGAAALHLGDQNQALIQARQNIDAYFALDPHANLPVINNAGGCGAALKEYAHLLRDDPHYADKARRFTAQVMDISEFLVDHLHVAPQGALHRRVTYADSCHLRHAQKIVRPPRELLRLIPGLELVELQRPERCCGSAGVYNIQQWQTAEAVLAEKMADIEQTGADTVAAANTGCYLQLVYGAAKNGGRLRVVHVVELLDESYRLGEQERAMDGVK